MYAPTAPAAPTAKPAAPAAKPTPDADKDDLSWAPPASGNEPQVSVFGLRRTNPPAAPTTASEAPLPSTTRIEDRAKPEVEVQVDEADIAGLLDDLEESVDALLDDIDAGFDRIVTSPGTEKGAGAEAGFTEHETREVRELFTQIAAGHMRPVRDFMIELKLGDPPREWIDLVRPAVSSLGKSAEGMGLTELRAATDVYLEALDVVVKSETSRITAEQAKELTDAFDLLASELPGAFDLNEERDRREPIIVQSLLRQIPDVRKVALDKLYAAGLTSLEMYYAAKPYDVAQAAGLSEELAGRIVRRFAQYRRETSVGAPDLERTHEHKKLAVLTAQLAQQNEGFDAASKSWSSRATQDKKRLRKERNDTVLELNVLLARLGEVDLVKQLEKLPFQGKVDALRAYMEAVKERAAAEGRR